MPRLRQLVLAAPEVEPVSAQLSHLLGTSGHRDPDMARLGLGNAVHPVGDGFVEVVAPVAAGTAVGRWLDRGGPGGYMAMAEVSDLAAARTRLARLGVRVVWDVAQPPDDSGPGAVDLHLHPKDVGGALLALDVVDPPGSWRWAGPGWCPGAPGGLVSLTVAVPDPYAVCRRWAEVLGVPPVGDLLPLAGQEVRFAPASGRPGIVAATVALTDPPVRTALVAGIALTLEDCS